jgi:NAD(P)-dependent dehydrogenase (short-subunit alcohol dehydrogenase family)
MKRLEDRVAIVTGGGRGLGLAYAQALGSEGAKVVLADVIDASETATEIGEAMSIVFDVSDESDVRQVVEKTVDRWRGVDILVNNAAVFSTLEPVSVGELEAELWDRVMAVNVRGPFLMAKHVAPHMIAKKYGKIINVSSGVAFKGMPYMSHYSASKAALFGLTRSLSRELGEHNICVNTLAPGLILSDSITANREHLSTYQANAVSGRAIKRDGYPEDLLGALVFLASSDSDFITGQTIAVDGGSVNT